MDGTAGPPLVGGIAMLMLPPGLKCAQLICGSLYLLWIAAWEGRRVSEELSRCGQEQAGQECGAAQQVITAASPPPHSVWSTI